MTTPTHDYSEFQETPEESQLAELSRLADRQAEAEREVARAEATLAEAQEKLREVSEKAIPDLMERLGLEKFTTTSGFTVDIKEILRTSITKANADAAHNWLDEHGHGSIVKRLFAITFGKDEEKWAAKFQRDLAQRKKPVNAVISRSVHPSTLKSFVKTSLEEGEDIPLDLFSVHRQRVSKISG